MSHRWFSSRQFRRTSEMWHSLQKLRDAQCDLLPAEDLQYLDGTLRQTKADLDARADDAILAGRAQDLDQAAQKWLRPYPYADCRDVVEILLVAVVLAIAIRTFLTQPFKIPTGSMQPTLYGITVQDLRDDGHFVMPGVLGRIFDAAVFGEIYHQVIAPADCEFDHSDPVRRLFGFINKQVFWMRDAGGKLLPITIYCGPDANAMDSNYTEKHTGLRDEVALPRAFRKGEPILQFVEHTGDHLFVNRMTYNFRHPRRGEIIVFKTEGIPAITEDQYYIKRLIGLPGETITIGDDRHVRINGARLDASTPHFAKVYGFDPNTLPQDSHYSGHTLPVFSNMKTREDKLKVRPDHYAVFGDNTVSSSDSRYWGDFPEENIMGQAWLVYWPFSPRWGFLGNR